MFGSKKLALLFAGLAGLMAVEASARTVSPFTGATFYAYYAKTTGGGQVFRHNAQFYMAFVHWSDKNPTWSTTNISWVEKWSGSGGNLSIPREIPDPQNPGKMINDTIPPWERPVSIPEPGTALLTAGLLSVVALRRRTI